MTRSLLSVGYFACDAVCIDGMLSGHALGGTAANVAANLAFFGWDASVAGTLGADPAGRKLRRDFRSAAVDARALRVESKRKTPVVIHHVSKGRHRFLFTCPTCRRRLPRHRPLSPDDVPRLLQQDQQPDVFFFDRVSVASVELARELRKRGSLIFFEPGSAGRPALAREAAALAHVLKFSSDRHDQLHRHVVRARPRQLQIHTAGADGLHYRISSDVWRRMPAPVVSVADSAGAGDWLTAAFLEALPKERGADQWKMMAVERALSHAQRVAALSCTMIGARGLTALGHVEIARHVHSLARGRSLDLQATRASNALRPSQATASCRVCLAP